jgi:hypothetical protein
MLPLYAKVCELCNRGRGRCAVESHLRRFSDRGSRYPEKLRWSEIDLKFPKNQPTNELRKAVPNSKGEPMQISSISSMPPIGASASAPAAASKSSSATVSAVAPSAPAAKPATQSPSVAVSAPSSSHGSSSASSASSSAQEAALSAVYSDTVGGKSYSGSVAESNGEYVASVPNLAGASASGSSIPSAENNLNTVIDALV